MKPASMLLKLEACYEHKDLHMVVGRNVADKVLYMHNHFGRALSLMFGTRISDTSLTNLPMDIFLCHETLIQYSRLISRYWY